MLKGKKVFIAVIMLMVLIFSACSSNGQDSNALNTSSNNSVADNTGGEIENNEDSTNGDGDEVDDNIEDEVSEGVDLSEEVSYSNDILPIFTSACQQCHGDSGVRAGLSVITYEDLMAGSNSGLVVLSGDADASKLVKLIISGAMPKNKASLSTEQIQLIKDWVNQGAMDN